MKKIVIGFLIGIVLMCATGCDGKTASNDIPAEFQRSVFMGDSITEGFAFNEILEEETVIARTGTTAGFIYEDVDILVKRAPDNVFIMLGSVDLLMPVDDPKQLFEDELTKLVGHIKDKLPKCSIYLQSITPVSQKAIEQEPRYENIEDYNGIIRGVVDKLSVNYVDIASLAIENFDLIAEDGIHFKKEFYYLWLEKLAELL